MIPFESFTKELLALKCECDKQMIPYPKLRLDRETFNDLNRAFQKYVFNAYHIGADEIKLGNM